MLFNYFLFFANKSLLNLRDLSEKNDTLLNENTTFPFQKKRSRDSNKDGDDKYDCATLFGIPIIFVILFGALIFSFITCIVLYICRCCEDCRPKKYKPNTNNEKKSEYDKKIEMSQMKRDYNYGHINLNSL